MALALDAIKGVAPSGVAHPIGEVELAGGEKADRAGTASHASLVVKLNGGLACARESLAWDTMGSDFSRNLNPSMEPRTCDRFGDILC